MSESERAGTSGSFMAVLGSDIACRPQAVYAKMRGTSPVLPVAGMDGPAVVVTGRSEVDTVLRHPEIYSSAMRVGRLGNIRPLIPIEVDPPDQKKFRRLLDPLFAPQRLAYLEEPVANLVNELIDRFDGDEEIDFSTQFSIPFPSQVFLTLLGLPLDDLTTFLAMKDGIIRPFHVLGKPMDHPDVRAHQADTARSIYDYFNSVLDQRERDRRDDLLSGLLDATIDGDRLGREEILDICFLFLTAGLDTVSASLDCFYAYLAAHPGHRARLVDDPSVIPHVVEELLRWESPVMLVSRVARSDTVLAGCPVRAGTEVYTFLGSANTDESAFPGADSVDWDRPANRHIAFGEGIHRCLGSNLARLELRVALREWHARIPHYQLKPGVELAFTPGVRSIDTFPMMLGTSVRDPAPTGAGA